MKGIKTLPYKPREKVEKKDTRIRKLPISTTTPLEGFPKIELDVLTLSTTKIKPGDSNEVMYVSKAKAAEPIEWDWKKSDSGKYTIADYQNLISYVGLPGPDKNTKNDYVSYVTDNKSKIKNLLK